MKIAVTIKGKKIQECSFNERTALAIVVSHCEMLASYFDSIATAGDLLSKAFTPKSANASEDEQRVPAIERFHPKVVEFMKSRGSAFAARYFPEFEFEFSEVSPSAPQS
ncbi:hypothetical protein [Polyangium fumosum]|uniref:Uncharacterized protein n=1 Tax=Polyangium fumosum TaxID=889272 RepID=A0A4U1J9L9_9BACT|nr:hypothetical protein [Polyangium fumosum]TKD05109.1 hypothetical protein E8A74_21420 [Polyangium fumosum]